MNPQKLQIDELEKRIEIFAQARVLPNPTTGWIRALRSTLGMPMRQLASKLSITKQSVLELEIREMEGRITLNALRDAANAMDMELVYGLVPREGSLQTFIDKKTRELAQQIVSKENQKD